MHTANERKLTMEFFKLFFHSPLSFCHQIARVIIGKRIWLSKEEVLPFSARLYIYPHQNVFAQEGCAHTSSLTTSSLFGSIVTPLTFSSTWRTNTDILSLYPFMVTYRPTAWGEKLYDKPANSALYENSVKESFTISEYSLANSVLQGKCHGIGKLRTL